MSIRKSLRFCYKKILISLFQYIYPKPTKFFKFKNYKYIKINNGKDKRCNYKIYKENNVRVYTDDLYNLSVIKNNSLISNLSIQLDQKGIKKNINENEIFKKGTPKFKHKIKGPILVAAQGASGYNYFHWFFDILPKIYLANKIYDLNYFNFFYLPEIKYDYQIQTLKRLKIPKRKILSSKRIKFFSTDEIVLTEHPYFRKNFWWDNYKSIPKWIVKFNTNKFKSISKKNFKKGKKIFIDRTDTKHPHNQISNIKEIYKIIKKNNFEIVKLTEKKFSDQVSIFKNANTILAPHGAGLKNIIYCKKKSTIIELKEKKFMNNYLYQHLSKLCGLSHTSINSKKYVKNKMFIDTNYLKKILKKYE